MLQYHTVAIPYNLADLIKQFIMPPTLKKLKGDIALGLSVHPSKKN